LQAGFGLNPLAFHLANVLLHGGNAVLLFHLLRRLFLRCPGWKGDSRALSWCAAVGTLFWAIHPLRVEPVAWATGLPYCQSMLFVLVSALCYLRFASVEPRSWLFYALSWLFFLLSVLTYPVTVTYAFLLPILDRFVLNRFPQGLLSRESRAVWLEKVPFMAVTALLLTIALHATQPTGHWVLSRTDPPDAYARFMQAAYVAVYYLWKPWWPVDISPVYTTLISFDPDAWPFVLSFAFLCALIAVSAWKRHA